MGYIVQLSLEYIFFRSHNAEQRSAQCKKSEKALKKQATQEGNKPERDSFYICSQWLASVFTYDRELA